VPDEAVNSTHTACTFLFLGLVVRPTNLNDSQLLFVCLLFSTYAISATAGNASVCGLMVITIERFMKIVHPVAYRNHYRPWMTQVGVVLPWIFGICTALVPTWATTGVVRGRCTRGRVGSSVEEHIVWSVAMFLLLYVGPLVVFVLGYWQILASIRRQRKQVAQSQPQGTSSAVNAVDQKSRHSEVRYDVHEVRKVHEKNAN